MPVEDLILFERLRLLSKLNSDDYFKMLSIALVSIVVFYFYSKEKNNE